MSVKDESAMQDNEEEHPLSNVKFKVVFLGDPSVGKSCLLHRFARNTFSGVEEPTIGAAFVTRDLRLEKALIRFEIWDTAGAERYRSLAPMYYRGSSVALVVYDITSQDWVNEIYTELGPNNLIVLTGNKLDLSEKRMVDEETARAYAESNKLLYFETSAKTGQNVFQMFCEIGRELQKNYQAQQKSNSRFQVKLHHSIHSIGFAQLGDNRRDKKSDSRDGETGFWSCCYAG